MIAETDLAERAPGARLAATSRACGLRQRRSRPGQSGVIGLTIVDRWRA